MIKRIFALIYKEFIQIRRDRRMLAVVLVAPVLQLIFLGYAANMDVKVIETAIWDNDKSQTSRNFLNSLSASGYFKLDYTVENYNEINELINRGKILVAIVIPTKFEEKVFRNESPKIQLIFDGSNGNKASIVLGYLLNIANGFTRNILIEKIQKQGIPKPTLMQITAEARVLYNPDMVTRVYLLPGILALILLIITLPLTSMAIVREREIGTLEQLIVTPLKKFEIIFGKLIPFVIIGFFDFLLVTIVMRFWFGIEIRGSFLFLLTSSLFFVICNLGLGLLISTISKTQQQAMMISVFGFIVPMIYLSGFVFPIENMPEVIQFITYALPLRYYLVIIRGVVLKGVGCSVLSNELIILVVFAFALMFISTIRFQKKLG